MFTEVKQTSKPLPQLVSEEIEKLIVLGEFKPGDRLPMSWRSALVWDVAQCARRRRRL